MFLLDYNDFWTSAMDVVVNLFMKILDWMFLLTLPGTNIPLYVLWFLAGIISIICRIVGSSPSMASFSSMASRTVSNYGMRVKSKISNNIRKVKNNNSKSKGGD